MEKVLSGWSSAGSHLIAECVDISNTIFGNEERKAVDPYVVSVVQKLYVSCHITSESALLLIRNGREWDADLLCRSVLEGTYKLLYMLEGNEVEIRQKCYEYWELLPDLAALKRSARADAFIRAVPNPESPDWIPIKDLMLPDDESERIKSSIDKKSSKQLAQRWSFMEIAKYFLESERQELKLLGHLGYGFGMSSHQVHKDGDGVGIIMERLDREADRYKAVKLGHCARVVSDVTTFAKLRLLVVLGLFGVKADGLVALEKKFEVLTRSLSMAAENFSRIEYGVSHRHVDKA